LRGKDEDGASAFPATHPGGTEIGDQIPVKAEPGFADIAIDDHIDVFQYAKNIPLDSQYVSVE
jgi:hypothetical protein